jgi:hypothetical protein
VRYTIGAALFLAAALAALIMTAGPGYLHGLLVTTVQRQIANQNEASSTVFWLGFTYVWVIVLLALLAFVLNLKNGKPTAVFFGVLLAGVLAAPLNQARIHTDLSLYKHAVFGAWFGAIAAGNLISSAVKVHATRGWRIGAAILIVAALAGYGQGTTQFSYWPNTAPVVAEFDRFLTPSSGPVLSDEVDALNYYLGNRVTGTQLVNSWSAYAQTGILDHQFSYIELGGTLSLFEEQNNDTLIRAIAQAGGYRPIFTAPWRDHWFAGTFTIWKYTGAPR